MFSHVSEYRYRRGRDRLHEHVALVIVAAELPHLYVFWPSPWKRERVVRVPDHG